MSLFPGQYWWIGVIVVLAALLITAVLVKKYKTRKGETFADETAVNKVLIKGFKAN